MAKNIIKIFEESWIFWIGLFIFMPLVLSFNSNFGLQYFYYYLLSPIAFIMLKFNIAITNSTMAFYVTSLFLFWFAIIFLIFKKTTNNKENKMFSYILLTLFVYITYVSWWLWFSGF